MQYTNLKPQGYMPRFVDALVEQRLQEFGAIEICGTRWCGKSWTASAFSESITRIDSNAELYASDPSLALIGSLPHLIDEWQDVSSVWNCIRHQIDDTANRPGQFLLTGSSTAPTEEKRHSGAGRISRIRMRTMTLAEREECTPTVSLAALFNGEFQPQEARLGLDDYARIICHGGWPALVGSTESRAQATIKDYLDLLFEVSMRKLGKDPVTSRKIATSLARNLGTSATLSTIGADAANGEDQRLTDESITSYLNAFAMNYFLDELPGWDAPVRSKSRVRTKPKRYLDDPSLAASLLSVGSSQLLSDGQLFGMLFESLCIHDLSVYASLLPESSFAPLRYYADADGLEVDVIIELNDGRWAPLEIKLSESKVDEAAKNIERLVCKIKSNPAARNREPTFKAILVAKAPYAHQRKEDGVYVIPLETLTA